MGIERQASPEVVAELRRRLSDAATPLPEKYRVLFSLRNIAGPEAQEAIMQGLRDPSTLLRHEVAYCLGQRQDAAAMPALAALLADAREHAMVRHEAAEALGAIGAPGCLPPLAAHAADACLEVAQTCQLALQRVAFFEARDVAGRDGSGGGGGGGAPAAADDPDRLRRYLSVDPTPPALAGTPLDELRATLTNGGAPIFERYRAMFALRDAGGAAAAAALTAVFSPAEPSALLKHEAAYALGQMGDASAAGALAAVLADAREHAMVRHEAAESLGAIAEPGCVALLKQFARDPEPIVADSCVVALDMLEHEQSGKFEYCFEVKQ